MRRFLPLLLVLLVLDLYLLFRLGARLGGAPTLAWVLGSALLGASLGRRQAGRVVAGWQAAASAGQVPPEGMWGGALALASALLLVFPGPLTDVGGLLLAVPAVRDRAIRWGKGRRAAPPRPGPPAGAPPDLEGTSARKPVARIEEEDAEWTEEPGAKDR